MIRYPEQCFITACGEVGFSVHTCDSFMIQHATVGLVLTGDAPALKLILPFGYLPVRRK